MKKLILPELIKNTDLPEKMSQKEFEEMLDEHYYEFNPMFRFDVDGLRLVCSIDTCDEGDYMYAYIVGAEQYYDYAIIATDDFQFRTYAQWKKAVKAMAAQLVKRWKAWVSGLYVEE